MFNAKKITAFATAGLLSAFALGCGATIDVKNFSLSSAMFTEIDQNGNASISTTLASNPLVGIKYYKLQRKVNDGDVSTIGPTEMANTEMSYTDAGLQDSSSYSYIIKAYDVNNKEVDGSRKETDKLTPIGKDLPDSTVTPPSNNKITDESSFSWSTAQGVEYYYAQLTDVNGEVILGAYTDSNTTSIALNTKTSPVAETSLSKALLTKFPIVTNKGIKEGMCYTFKIITIKSDTGDIKTAKAIGVRKSPAVSACWSK